MTLKRAVRHALATKLAKQSLCPEPLPTSEFPPMVVPVDNDWASDRVDRKSTLSGHLCVQCLCGFVEQNGGHRSAVKRRGKAVCAWK